MALISQAWRALLRRNFVYRKRHFITTGFEILLPVAFLGIVVALKNAADVEDDDFVSEVKNMGFYENISNFVALLMTLGLLYPAAATIRYMVSEKEHQQKEYMKMMGVNEFALNFAWFSSFFMVHLVTSVLLTFVSSKLFQQADFVLLLLFWVFSLTALIVVAMLVASLFSKTPRATFVGLLVFFFGYFCTLAEDFATGSPANLRLVSLHPVAAFSYGLREIGRLEDGNGLTMDSINVTVYPSGYTYVTVLRYLFFDCILWGTVTWYLNRVIPPSYGQALPFYFPFVPSYWCPSIRAGRSKIDIADSAAAAHDPNIPMEPVSEALRIQAQEGKSIEIHDLKKRFGEKIALEGLNLSIYNGQITALLGVNGAGKTTTINILTGALAPTEGTAVVAGKDIHTFMPRIRQDLGICLQHNCIFPSLTVREHVQLFSRIKGLYSKMSYKEAEEKVSQSLRDVALSDKSNSLAKTLSGGMKRKLNVAMAFCAESPLIILDEPTSGMDPFARRFIWDLIRRYRQNRTIILTTHQMDEADVLGDQIAILANGKLRCCGSSLFLKKSFGVGYQLTIEKGAGTHHNRQTATTMITKKGSDLETEMIQQGSGSRDVKQEDEMLKQIVLGTVTEGSLLINVAGEMRFQIPLSASSKFCPMLERLDDEVSRGFIDSYGLSLTTLEEVFLLVSRGDSIPGDPGFDEKEVRSSQILNAGFVPVEEEEGKSLFFRHIQALFYKRLLNFRRDKKAWLFTTILPSLFVLVGFLLSDNLEIFAVWFLVVLSFPFITGAFGSFVVTEKVNKCKHLQSLAGVTPTAYWLSTFLWDVLNYQFTVWITISLMFAFHIDALTTTSNGVVGGVIALLLLFGPAAASFTYCTSFMFSSPAYCNVLNIVWGFLMGFGGTIVVFLLWFFGNGWNTATGEDDIQTSALDPKDKLIIAAEVLTWTLRIFPSFCLGKGLFMAINLSSETIDGDTSVWQPDIILYEVIFLAIESVLYLILVVQIDRLHNNPEISMRWGTFVRRISFGLFNSSKINISNSIPDDDDVVAEQDRVNTGEACTDQVVVDRLTKIWPNGTIAVDKLTLGIPGGEVFGLLGINGAGKTTTLGMLTTEFPPTGGDATLAGFSIRHQRQETRRLIGYCPQFDALLSNLSGREHVELYASIKGTPRSLVKQAASEKLAAVGLSESDIDRLANTYSGGMKRRLSLACATIGGPKLVFLDEPSSGVDPAGRREIWSMISSMATDPTVNEDERPSVILTTHSMEECEALCSRIGIMAHGKLRCLGSAQHLKSKFGKGYQLEMKVRIPQPGDQDFNEISVFLGRQKPGVTNELIRTKADQIFFNHHETMAALNALSGDTYLSNLVSAQNGRGSIVFKACSENGASLSLLSHFATTQLRLRNLHSFVTGSYPTADLRERQDLMARYAINSDGLRIAQIFAKIEESKEGLKLCDYSVSQTSLENVFQLHAAQAEAVKINH